MIPLINFNKYIKKQALNKGFVLCGVSKAEMVDSTDHLFLENWITSGRNAQMDWFNRNEDLRTNPSQLIEGGKTIVSFAYPYQPIENHNIAAYANNTDYHFTLKERLNSIISNIETDYQIKLNARAFTDSAPILERYWAVKSGLGWIGKSGMLINRQYGSYLLLGEIILDQESDLYDSQETFDGCATCRRCIKNCPTGAICNDRSIDARRCVSYLTIEHRGDFSEDQKALLSDRWVYGCDSCILCCPWNAKKPYTTPSVTVDDAILEMNNRDFRERYKNTPLERTGVKSIKRNYVR